jgi:hypothetical protein
MYIEVDVLMARKLVNVVFVGGECEIQGSGCDLWQCDDILAMGMLVRGDRRESSSGVMVAGVY